MRIQIQADDFLNAYLVLKENNKTLIEKLNNTSEKSAQGKTMFGAYPTGGVEIVCLAFSVELYIKCLHYALKGKAPRGHNILKLFEQLPKQIQKEILAYDSISQNPFFTRGNIFSAKRFSSDFSTYDGIIDQIKAISNGFEKWRYSYESASLKYDVFFALAFIESIKSVAEKGISGVR